MTWGMRRWLSLFLLVLLPALRGQDPYTEARPSVRIVGNGEGLPGDTVHDLLLDAQGHLWAATFEGPARFNGQRWVAVPLPDGAPSRQVRAMLQSRDGSLWFGTQDGGVWRLFEGAWQHFTTGTGLPSNRVNCLLETEEGGSRTLWVGTAGGGIARYSGGTWTQPDASLGLKDGWIWKLRSFQEPDGTRKLWAATRGGLWTFTQSRWSRVGRSEGFLGSSANDLVEVVRDGRREVWASCWELGVARWDGRRWEHFGPREGFPSRYPTSLGVSVDAAGQSRLWVGTFDHGLAWLEGRRWRSFTSEQGLPVVGAYALAVVPGGRPTLWVGTRGAGVVAVDLGGWLTVDSRHGLPGSEVRAFAEFREPGGFPAFWIGTVRGFARWDGNTWKTDRNAGRQAYVFDLAVAPDALGRDTLWAGTLGGLLRWTGGAWEREGPGLMGQASVNSLLSEPGGRGALWVGSNAGLACLREGRWRFHTTADGLPGNWITCLAWDAGGHSLPSLWVGTRGQGIGRYRDGQWTRYAAGSGLPGLTVRALAPARLASGKAWMLAGMQGGGLAGLELDREGALWGPVALPPGSGSVLSFVQDAFGRIYVATTRGILRCRPEERGANLHLEVLDHYTTGDGLPTETLQDHALYQDQSGRIWVATARGAAVLDPRLDSSLPALPSPWLEGIEVQGRPIPPRGTLRLGYRDTRAVFRYALAVYHRPEDLRFRSWIKGLEAEPTDWQPDGVRELSGPPPGRYTLHVWARDHAGRVTGPLLVPFTVQAPPWGRWWAYLGYGVVAVSGVMGVIHGRTRLLRHRQRILEARVQTALAEVKTLQGLLPICAYCKKIRDDQGAWDPLEHYLGARSNVTFSHGICPDCNAKLREEMKGLGKG